MKCKWSGCDNERRLRSPFCGDTCYKRWVRANSDKIPVLKSDKPNSDRPENGPSQTKVPEKGVGVGQKSAKNPVSSEIPRQSKTSAPVTDTPDIEPETRIASIDDYYAHRDDYAERACPELLNWGAWMDTADLEQARLSGNRVTLPGDWDYVG